MSGLAGSSHCPGAPAIVTRLAAYNFRIGVVEMTTAAHAFRVIGLYFSNQLHDLLDIPTATLSFAPALVESVH